MILLKKETSEIWSWRWAWPAEELHPTLQARCR